MICPRCKSLMVVDVFEDLLDETCAISFKAWRCIPCGEVIDPVILKNRMQAPGGERSRSLIRDGATAMSRVSVRQEIA